MSLNFPPSPSESQIQTLSNRIQYIYSGGKWTSVGAIVDHDPDSDNPTIVVGSTPPANPNVGEMWFNTVKGILFIWYRDEDQSGVEGQWTDVRPPVN
jgi:hypothetical protein